MADFSTYVKLQKPLYRVLRYDLSLNDNMDRLDAALRHFPSEFPPGSDQNYSDIVLSNGLTWLDTGNDQLKMYYGGVWVVIHSF